MKYNAKSRYVTISAFEKKWNVHFTVNHLGKMEGMISLSTSPLCNPLCRKRAQIANTICSHCYSFCMMKRFGTLAERLAKNTEVLTTKLIPVEEWPILNARYVRFEAFGDIVNARQMENYVNLCKRNPSTKFAIWTKNYAIAAKALEKTGKPKNLTLLVSSPLVNVALDLTKFPLADKCFTVYSTCHAAQEGIDINCGARACLLCHKCYERTGAKHIRERLK